MEIILVCLSLLGYIFIYKKYRILSYLTFIVQNLIALNIYQSAYMLVNIFACFILITIITAQNNRYGGP